MQAQILCQLPVKTDDWQRPGSWQLHKRSDGILGIVWMGKEGKENRHRTTISCMQFDLSKRLCVGPLVYSCFCNYRTGLRLTYDPQKEAWVVAWVQPLGQHALNPQPAGMNLLLIYENNQILSADPHPLFIEESGQLIHVGADTEGYSLLYLQPQFEEDLLGIPEIRLAHYATTKSRKHIHVQELTLAVATLAYVSADACLLLACRPIYTELWRGQWRINMLGGKRYFTARDWEHTLDIGLPIMDDYEQYEDFLSGYLSVEAALIDGSNLQPQGKETFVAGVAMTSGSQPLSQSVNIFLKGLKKKTSVSQRVAKLLHITSEGQLISECQSPIGEKLCLLLVGSTVLGLDRVEGRQRLWRWLSLTETTVQDILWLDANVRRAYLVADQDAQERGANHFWLIEETKMHVKISKRDATTIAEVTPPLTLTDFQLLPKQKEEGAIGVLNWQSPTEFMSYQHTLVLLGSDNHGQVLLCQVI